MAPSLRTRIRSRVRSQARTGSGPRTSLAVGSALALTAAVAAGSLVADPSTASAAPAAECAASGFCEDFESQTGDELSGRWSAEAADCTGTGVARVDTTEAHSGSTSVRVDGGGGYCNHMFAATSLDDVASSTTHLRFWVKHTTALPASHVTFAALNDANDGDRDLRMGGQNGALQWNRESDDATLPEQSPNGVALSLPLPVDTWTCVEARIDGSGLLETAVDGTPVEGLIVDGEPTQDIDSQWLRKSDWGPSLTDLRLGWESYGGDADTLWFDDVAVGDAPIGC